ncbi:MAG: hypothetical protein HY064_13550 [Bacteroidetes bacterium]|nr:hypothetical protein [Bacteroidota bacterium]
MKKLIIPASLIAIVVIAVSVYHSKNVQPASGAGASMIAPARTTTTIAQDTRHPYEESFSALNIPESEKQHFTLNARSAQVIVGNSGTIISIPEDAFADKNGNPVTGKVKMQIVEGISNADIMKMNLGTMSDQGLLQTGGMVYMNALSENGDTLSLQKGKELEVEIPAAHVKEGMKLWNGEVQKDGSLLWKNPQDLKNGLRDVPVENIDSSLAKAGKKSKYNLDSQNEMFLARRAAWGYTYWGNAGNITDSSLIDAYKVLGADTLFHWKTGMSGVDSVVNVLMDYRTRGYDAGDVSNQFSDTSNVVLTSNNFSNGSLVHLDDKKFEHTNISTAEFRSRLPFIRQACDQKIMNCYTDNPNRALWKSDGAAADSLDKISCPLAEVFREFAKLKQDKIDPKDPHTVAALDNARNIALQNYSRNVRNDDVTLGGKYGGFGSYSFGMKKLGWANVDRLMHNCGANDVATFFNAHLDGINSNENPQVSLLIPDQEIFIPGYKRPNGDYSFTHGEQEQEAFYPKGTTAYIFARTGDGNKLRYVLKKFVMGENKIENATLAPGTENEMIRALGNQPVNDDDNTIIDDWTTRNLKSGWGCICAGEERAK